jgi:hypothetical protein
VKEKMRVGPKIGVHYDITFGLKTGDDSKFVHSVEGLHREDKPLLRGDDVKRYYYSYKSEFVWYVPVRMRAHRKTARPGEPARFEQPKVIVKDTSTGFSGTYDERQYYVKDVLILTPKRGDHYPLTLKGLTGLINSRALWFYYRTTFKTLHVQSGELGSLPLPAISPSRDVTKSLRQLDALVDQMLQAEQSRREAMTIKDEAYYEARVNSLEREIDAVVYSLYGIDKRDIGVIDTALGD